MQALLLEIDNVRVMRAGRLTRPYALRRILTNLIDNALKFAGEAEVSIGKTHEGRTSITVLDHGPDIPEVQLEAVLQSFCRLAQSRNHNTGGTGLGLAVAHQLPLAIGGRFISGTGLKEDLLPR